MKKLVGSIRPGGHTQFIYVNEDNKIISTEMTVLEGLEGKLVDYAKENNIQIIDVYTTAKFAREFIPKIKTYEQEHYQTQDLILNALENPAISRKEQ